MYNNCTDPSKYCNCDARSEKEATDEGALTNKKHLPMWRIEFLDVSSWKGSKGRFSLGALKCSGDGEIILFTKLICVSVFIRLQKVSYLLPMAAFI